MKNKYSLSMVLLASRFIAAFLPRREEVANSLTQREVVANQIREIEAQRYEEAPATSFEHDRITEANASLMDQAYFNEPLTNYAVGFRDDLDVDASLEFYAPMCQTPRRFSYAVWDNAEEFLSSDDDERPIGCDFKNLEYTSSKVEAKTANRGLQIYLDMDELDGMPNWEEIYTAKLLRRLKRNSLRRAVNLLAGTATNVPLTWSAVAGKDPDQDILGELVTASDLIGIRPNRVGFGDTSWTKRLLAHRFQANAGGFASAALTPEQLAAFLQVDGVEVTKSRYTSSATARTQVLSNLALIFLAEGGMSVDDPSNIKRFVSMGSADQGGGKYQVYSQRISAKRYVIAVGHYELIKLTSPLGMRKLTIS